MGVCEKLFVRTFELVWIAVLVVLISLIQSSTAVHNEGFVPFSRFNNPAQATPWISREAQYQGNPYPAQISQRRLQRFQNLANQRRFDSRMSVPYETSQRSRGTFGRVSLPSARRTSFQSNAVQRTDAGRSFSRRNPVPYRQANADVAGNRNTLSRNVNNRRNNRYDNIRANNNQNIQQNSRNLNINYNRNVNTNTPGVRKTQGPLVYSQNPRKTVMDSKRGSGSHNLRNVPITNRQSPRNPSSRDVRVNTRLGRSGPFAPDVMVNNRKEANRNSNNEQSQKAAPVNFGPLVLRPDDLRKSGQLQKSSNRANVSPLNNAKIPPVKQSPLVTQLANEAKVKAGPVVARNNPAAVVRPPLVLSRSQLSPEIAPEPVIPPKAVVPPPARPPKPVVSNPVSPPKTIVSSPVSPPKTIVSQPVSPPKAIVSQPVSHPKKYDVKTIDTTKKRTIYIIKPPTNIVNNAEQIPAIQKRPLILVRPPSVLKPKIPTAVDSVKKLANLTSLTPLVKSASGKKKPLLLLLRNPDGRISPTVIKIQPGSDGQNVATRRNKIIDQIKVVGKNNVVEQNNVSGRTKIAISTNIQQNPLLGKYITQKTVPLGRVPIVVPESLKTPPVNNNPILVGPNSIPSLTMPGPRPVLPNVALPGQINTNLLNQFQPNQMNPMIPFVQQTFDPLASIRNWDGQSANVPLILQKMGITHGSQLSPMLQETLFGDTIDPPDPTPAATETTMAVSKTTAGGEVEANKLPPTTPVSKVEKQIKDVPQTASRPKAKKQTKKIKRKRKNRGHRMKVSPSTTIATTRATTPSIPLSVLKDNFILTTQSPNDVAISLAKKLLALFKEGDPAANGIMKSLNINLPPVTPQTTARPVITDVRVTKTIKSIVKNPKPVIVKPVRKNNDTPIGIVPRRPGSAMSDTKTNPNANISLSSFMSGNELGGVKIERITPKVKPVPVKKLVNTEGVKPVQDVVGDKKESVFMKSNETKENHLSPTIPLLPKTRGTTAVPSPTSRPVVPLEPKAKSSVVEGIPVENPKEPIVNDVLPVPAIQKIVVTPSTSSPAPTTIDTRSQVEMLGEAVQTLNANKAVNTDPTMNKIMELLSSLQAAIIPKPKTATEIPNVIPTSDPQPKSQTSNMTQSIVTSTQSSPTTKVQPKLDTTTQAACTPFTQGFQCRGKDFFGTLGDTGKWCVDTCRTKGCVQTVCECNCNAPVGPTRQIPVYNRPGQGGQRWQDNRRFNRRWNGRRHQVPWWQKPKPTTEEPPEADEAEDMVVTTTEAMTTMGMDDYTYGFYSDEYQTTPSTFAGNAKGSLVNKALPQVAWGSNSKANFNEPPGPTRPPPSWRGTQWELPPAPIKPKQSKKDSEGSTQNNEATGWSEGAGQTWQQGQATAPNRWNQPVRNQWNNGPRFTGGSRNTWREPIGNGQGNRGGSWVEPPYQQETNPGDAWRRNMFGDRRSVDSVFSLRQTWRDSKYQKSEGGEEAEQ